jgi:hypothetical protein
MDDRSAPGRRCTAHSKSNDGKQCRNNAMPGLTVCHKHGGLAPQVQHKVQHARLRRGLDKLLVPVPEDHPEANPLESFSYEYRRTIAAIEYWTERIRTLTDERDLVWGQTREKVIGSGEYPGVDTEYEAKINIYEERRMLERRHLVELMKLYVKARIDVHRLQIESDTVSALNAVISAAILAIGADPNDPAVRAAVNGAFGQIAGTRPELDAADRIL